jgi:DNA-binding HxlR family transcriptional regulator
MAEKRHYEDGCAAAHALELIGERWALLIIRELMLGPRRFTDLRSALPGISPNVLTQRLDELEHASIVVRRKLPPPASVRVYDLSDWGRELEPVMLAIGRWAARSPGFPLGRPISINSLILSFRTMFDPARAKGLSGCIGLVIDGQEFTACITEGRLTVEPGATGQCAARLEGDANMIAAVVYGGMPLDAAIADGLLQASGKQALLERFTGLFPLPDRAPDLIANA